MAGNPEFSRPLPLERLGDAPHEARIEADEAERAALAARFGLLALPRLEAGLRVFRTGAGARLRLEGRLEVEVVQACVVSLEPVPSRIAEDFAQVYELVRPDPSGGASAPDLMVTPGPEDEDPEPLGPGGLDLGEAVAQQLALALDPYPRAPGAAMPAAPTPDPGADSGRRRPFEVLRELKPRRP